jgi:hypothetical protein
MRLVAGALAGSHIKCALVPEAFNDVVVEIIVAQICASVLTNRRVHVSRIPRVCRVLLTRPAFYRPNVGPPRRQPTCHQYVG